MDLGTAYRALKLAGTGVFAAALGIFMIASGETQGIVAGIGSLTASAIVFAFLGWVLFRKEPATPAEAVGPADAKRRGRVLWLGLGLVLLPGVMYLYLRHSMADFNPLAVVVLGVPMLVAGLGCLAAGLWSPRPPAAGSDDLIPRGPSDPR